MAGRLKQSQKQTAKGYFRRSHARIIGINDYRNGIPALRSAEDDARKVAEPDGQLTVKVLKERLCAHFQTTVEASTLNVSA